eukprot:6792088-Prorocentrum_lima.AAC.1
MGSFQQWIIMDGVQRRTNTSTIHSNRPRTRSEGKQSCDEGKVVEFRWDKMACGHPNHRLQTVSGLLQQQIIAQAVT